MTTGRSLAIWALAAIFGMGLTLGAQAALLSADRNTAVRQAALLSVDRNWAATQRDIVYFVHTRQPDVALTFDDGPNPADTPRILTALTSAGAHATFFVLGSSVERHPGLVRQIVAQGSGVGLHSFSHPNMARLGSAQIAEQVRRSAAEVERATGSRPALFRFPYFSHTRAAVRAVRDLGYTIVEASVDPKDWSHPGVEAIVRRATQDVRPGDILLFHDGGGQWQTAAALPRILAALGAKGLRCVTVSELLRLGPPSYEPPPAG